LFTGLIEAVGTVEKIERRTGMYALSFTSSFGPDPLRLGESIAVNGACLTVVETTSKGFSAECSPETLAKTTLGDLKQRDEVNLERSLRLSDRLGGHLVTGHVDGVGKIEKKTRHADSLHVEISLPRELLRNVVVKGSVAVDGVSLTVNALSDRCFSVTIIPYTASHTTLVSKRAGSRVNIETDLIGKYVARWMNSKSGTVRQVDMDFLEEEGFF
jgi:riboflavin synthase